MTNLQKLREQLSTATTEFKIIAIDNYLAIEQDILNRNFVLAVSHLDALLMGSIIQTYIIYSKKPSKTLKELVESKSEKTFELNDITYNYVGDFKTQDPHGNHIIVPMFQELGKPYLVELDLNSQINRTF